MAETSSRGRTRERKKKEGVYSVLGSQVNGNLSGERRNQGKKVAMQNYRLHSMTDSGSKQDENKCTLRNFMDSLTFIY